MSTPNKLYETVCGKKIWHSRSVACAAVLIFTSLSDPIKAYCVVVKRSDEAESQPGKYCLPCGYLDWDESWLYWNSTGHDAAAKSRIS
jgi:hypothetical protein